MTSTINAKGNTDLTATEQSYGDDPLSVRETDQYRMEYIKTFVERWDELIDWEARAESEGSFFIDVLRSRGKRKILDVAAGTGFHSVRLLQAGFDVTSADGSAAMIAKAFENGQKRGLILKTVQADWRSLNESIQGKFDAIICLGNSFTHLHDEMDRRRVLAEFYAALKHDGILILDQRNYDSILDEGYSSKHKFYYCGDKVTAEPAYMDEGLARFVYRFPDKSEYTLNMFPLRKAYTRRLMQEAGFQQIHTYGDFQDTYNDSEPDFFIHVAEKSLVAGERLKRRDDSSEADKVRYVTEDYYDSTDADNFYFSIWGGEDIHVGLYEETDDVKTASHTTVERMASMVPWLNDKSHVLDIGAGYGGSARHLARAIGCSVHCLNISEVQNKRNREINKAQGLDDLVSVAHGSFEDIPEPDEAYDLVWSQDAVLHSGNREMVFREVHRVLKRGGEFIMTDPMQADDCPEGVLQPVYDRIHLQSLGSFGYYARVAKKLGFEVLDQVDLTHNLRSHYFRVRQELEAHREELTSGTSQAYIDRMLVGLENWVNAADQGYLAWGILRFRKR
ncbi:MAG: methyltransferase domain-containing protein [Azospirillaceae bacterium]